MKKSFIRIVLSLIIACSMIISMTSVCFATENNDVAELKAQATSFIEGENGVPLPQTSEDGIMPLSDDISDLRYGTTSGYIGGSFTVPNDYSGRLIKFFWSARTVDNANTSAVFKMTVNGHTFYLPVTSRESYSIGNLPAGTYEYSIEPYSNVSGTYFYGIQFYAL